MSETRPLPLILDTDIGDDIDDALALALILNSPELDLRGVTTVFVDAPRRARLARKMLGVWDRLEIPVAAGFSLPLLQPFAPQAGHQFGVLDDDGTTFEHALDFLVQSPALAPGERLTVLAIGPLTNIALALAREPELARQWRLVLMGGQGVPGTEPEWNIIADPEAAAMVFRSGIEIWQVGFDITTQVQLTAEHVQQIANHGSARSNLLADVIERWRNGRNHWPILHDPLAALTLLSDCVRFAPYAVDIELCGARRGMLSYEPPDSSSKAPCQVAVEVDAARAIELFMQRVLV